MTTPTTETAQTYYCWRILKSSRTTCKAGEYLWVHSRLNGPDIPYSTPLLGKADFFVRPDEAVKHTDLEGIALELVTVTMTICAPDYTKRATQKLEDLHA